MYGSRSSGAVARISASSPPPEAADRGYPARDHQLRDHRRRARALVHATPADHAGADRSRGRRRPWVTAGRAAGRRAADARACARRPRRSSPAPRRSPWCARGGPGAAGEPRVVVDDHVQVLVADPGASLGPAHVADAGDGVAWAAKADEPLDVHVQQRPRPRPLVAPEALTLAARAARDAVAPEHLPDRRARPPDDAREPPRPEVRLSPGAQDRLFFGRRQPPRLMMRPTRPVAEPRCRRSSVVLSTAHSPTAPPPVGGRRRHVQGGRGRPERHPFIDQLDKRNTARRSELGVSVQLHPGPPSRREFRKTHSLRTGPDVLSGVHNVCGQLT